jgi:hypothetical protein
MTDAVVSSTGPLSGGENDNAQAFIRGRVGRTPDPRRTAVFQPGAAYAAKR